MTKKSQGLSITTIIVAAIALVVLVVLVAIFTGRIGGFSAGIDAAQNKYCDTIPNTETGKASSAGGTVVSTPKECAKDKVQIYGVKGLGIGQICCSK
jgi:hypothetical protein